METKTQKPDTIKDKYLKKNVAGYWIVIVSLVLLFVSMLSWMLFGSYNLTVTGTAGAVEGTPATLFVSSDDIEKIQIGMVTNIGKSKGEVSWIGEEYYTYDDFFAVYGRSVKYLNIAEDKSYIEVLADITTEQTGYYPYTVVYKTITPLEHFLGLY